MPRFSEDLVQIRKKMLLSRQDVFFKCRIPLETIENLEDASVFTGSMKNKTYRRSYYRTYAKAIGISDSDITEALDQFESNSYEGMLAEKYLSGDEESSDADATEDEETPDERDNASARAGEASSADDNTSGSDGKTSTRGSEASAQVKEKSARSKKKDSQSEKESKEGSKKSKDQSSPAYEDPSAGTSSFSKGKIFTPQFQEKSIEDIEREDQDLNKSRSTSTSSFSTPNEADTENHADSVPEPPSMEQVDWAGRVKKAVYRPQRNRLLKVILFILIALIIAAGTIYWLWEHETESPAGSEESEEVLPQDQQPRSEAESDDQAAMQNETPDDMQADPEQEMPADPEPDPVGEMPADPEPDPVPEPEVTDMELQDQVESVDEQTTEVQGQFTLLETELSAADTLHVYVYALYGSLEPIRVQSDTFTEDHSLRPFRIGHQQAMRFDFTNEIIFQGALSRMALVFNGNLIDDFSDFYLDGPRISLNRDQLLSSGIFEQPDPDLFSEVPPPDSVLDRPGF